MVIPQTIYLTVAWNKYSNVLSTLGGHEIARQIQGEIPNTKPLKERLDILQKYWRHDIYYETKLVKNKVLCIGLFNDMANMYEIQKIKPKEDLALARQKGYIVLIFAHEPFASGNTKHRNITPDQAILKGYPDVFPTDMCDGSKTSTRITGGVFSNDVAKEVYHIIVNSADVVKGIFAGHYHSLW